MSSTTLDLHEKFHRTTICLERDFNWLAIYWLSLKESLKYNWSDLPQ
jgi:hypothetical protein